MILAPNSPVDSPNLATPEVPEDSDMLHVGSLVVDPGNRSVALNGRSIRLTTAEFDLLCFLARYPGQILSRDVIYREVRGIEYNGIDRSIDLRVCQLRKKLHDSPKQPQRIITIHGVGYLLTRDQ